MTQAPAVTLLLATGLQCRCPFCRNLVPLELDERIRGRQFECPHCERDFIIHTDAEIQIP
ncbi:hypothetical protein APB72_27075 [Pseudomonas aeruginosa]|uniref:hypothetical protein n=1 Tax=Pseudomonas aeruginosa TaxID=287 RepID=UPI00071B4F27|nr:hypothetical protein [Pseudomonas aeruginosa]KSQ02021.1 hypothetical protein APB25_26670 [Pseudomonas aeruginosa]KSS84077.1 hypothetical protein APB72_27075 [Pseudomonas aeruginosa]KSS99607.1 hypothetical protein APB71_31260 [Pseudomonas aeruginosa]MDA3250721.1 hypothetical protein [Pseudomonas aeruginosa]OFB97632.1 hypothetical protein AN472_32835 [Pseudomonas aeruginosa]